jgi:hypothetical protein
MGQRHAPGIAIQHRRQPPAHAALVNGHRFIRGKGADNLAFVAFANPLEIQFIMVTQPVDEAASGGATIACRAFTTGAARCCARLR